MPRTPAADLQKGSRHSTRYGDLVVVEYHTARCIDVRFLRTETLVQGTSANSIRRGCVGDPYAPTVSAVGYLGEGMFNSVSCPIAYRKWTNMLRRVYSGSSRHESYADCEVADDWLCFQNFASWYVTQPFCNDLSYELDKDLKIVGNRTYSGLTCSIIPPELNQVLSRLNKTNRYGTGVQKTKGNLYYAHIKEAGNYSYLGTFSSKEEAANAFLGAHKDRLKSLVSDLLRANRITSDQADIALKNYA